MFGGISLFSILWGYLIGIVLLSIYGLIIKPLLEMFYYTRQGGSFLFHKELVSIPGGYKNAREKADFYFAYNQILRKNPNTKFIVENFGPSAHVILTDTEMIKEFLRKYHLYHKNPQFYSVGKILGKGSITFEEAAAWKQRRKSISGAFNFEFLKDMIPMIVQSTQEKYSEWKKNGALTNVNIIDKFGTITGEVAGRFFFGKRFSEKKLKGLPLTIGMEKLLNELALASFTLPVILFGSKMVKTNILASYRELNKSIDEMRLRCKELIEETEKSGVKEHTLLKYLLELCSNDKENGLTNDDIIGEFIGVFGAGTDTSAHLAGVVIYFLWKYPHIFEKVKEEVDREFSDLSKISIEAINHMEYTTAVIKESLRLSGPAGTLLARVAAEEDNLCGVKLKKGTKINVCLPLLHHSEKYFSNPLEFIPERWLPNTPYSNDRFRTEPYAYIPFGGGPRNCIGQHLGMIESRIMIALFIKTFEFRFPEDYNLVLVQRFSFQPLDPLTVTLKPK